VEESPDVAGAEVGKLRQLKEQAAFEYLRMRADNDAACSTGSCLQFVR
jgi:hypothetical protein